LYCQKNRLLLRRHDTVLRVPKREHERYQPWYGFVDRIETVEFQTGTQPVRLRMQR